MTLQINTPRSRMGLRIRKHQEAKMTEAAAILRAARASAGLSQAEVAQRSGIDKSTISLIESGRRSPSVDKLDRLLHATGRRLGIYPTTRAGAAEAGASIREHVADADHEAALRVFLRYSDNLGATKGVERVMLAAIAPVYTGSDVWDAALAAVTRYWLERDGLPEPSWVDEITRTLQEPTPLIVNRWSSARSIRNVPGAFRRHRILVDEATLQSA
ncbi:helix-turn-helix domain-containing protein [Agromyces silvae]|uniref:helix-turn-helix domain-containing protein n=1 Tax=Agromyces silvae TaxID=3388266 RepID=UPI00280B4A79|nr:helix-turn-helix transcriptional regulator [Agromyces protaetiae]